MYSWGVILVRGYNITLGEWVSPLHPFQWSAGYQCVPPTSVFPVKGQGVPCPSSSSGGSGAGGGSSPQYHPSPGAGQGHTGFPCPPGFYYAGAGKCVPVNTAPNPSLPGGR